MKTYMLHVPADATPGDPRALDGAVLVNDGFSWGAFIFSFLWFFLHRLWMAGLMVLVAAVGLGALLHLLRVGQGATFLAELLLALLVGIEANGLRSWTLSRRRRPVADVVAARDLEEAETKAFARWLGEVAEVRPGSLGFPGSQTVPAATFRRVAEPVIGLFPEAERAR